MNPEKTKGREANIYARLFDLKLKRLYGTTHSMASMVNGSIVVTVNWRKTNVYHRSRRTCPHIPCRTSNGYNGHSTTHEDNTSPEHHESVSKEREKLVG